MGGSFDLAGFEPWQWLEIVEHELLLFAAVFFLIGALDELAVDLAWLRLKLAGRTRPQPFAADPVALVQARAVYLPEINANAKFQEFVKICGSATITMHNLITTSPAPGR